MDLVFAGCLFYFVTTGGALGFCLLVWQFDALNFGVGIEWCFVVGGCEFWIGA